MHFEQRLSWSILGWDEFLWNDLSYFTTPESEILCWDQLTSKEKISATYLCYTQEIWDSTCYGEMQTSNFYFS